MDSRIEILLKKQQKDIDDLKKLVSKLQLQLDKVNNEQSNQEIYYQKLVEKMIPGAGHMALKTPAGHSFITDVTTPDDWDPASFHGMPSAHIELKNVLRYKEIHTQLEMAQAALPRQLLIAILFVNPSVSRLKDIFGFLHPHGIKLAYFDHHDQLWWFDGQDRKPFTDMWKQPKESVKVLTDDIFAAFIAQHIEFGDPLSNTYKTLTRDVYTRFFAFAKNWNYKVPRENELSPLLVKTFNGKAIKKNSKCVELWGPKTVNFFEGLKLSSPKP